MNGILKAIWDDKNQEVFRSKRGLSEQDLLLQIQHLHSRPLHAFSTALRKMASERKCSVIAEVKKASPSKGVIRHNFQPAEIVRSYEAGGAACISVLTEQKYFQGSPEILQEARAASSLPILRKDFLLDPYQVLEAKAWGADAVLLIAAALSDHQLRDLSAAAQEVGLDVLVEAHDEEELGKALEVEEGLIGINNRNLETFEVDLSTTERLIKRIPSSRWVVTESGVRTREDVRKMKMCGLRSFLVGEAFMRDCDPGASLRNLFYAGD